MHMNTNYQLSKIAKSLKTVKDPIIRERLLMVKHAYESDSLRTAAEHVGKSHVTVKYWKDRYEQHGLKGLKPIPKSGRPRKLDPEQEIRLKRVVTRKGNKNGWQVKELREYIKEQADVTYTLRHTTRIMQQWGLSHITPRAQYAHTDIAANQAFLKGKH
jgi:transposase